MVEILKPESESNICDAVRNANGPFEIIGHGTKRGFGRATNAATLLDTSALSGIVKYEPEELVIAVKAATPISEIEAVLAQRNQMLGFEPANWGPLFDAPAGQATIAGVASANACGSRRVKAGAVRDHVIGCRFVNGAGEAIKAGGPVIKNVTGFDVTRLMCGAFGTLGVLTELTLRVTPKPERVAAFTMSCPAADGLRILREAAQMPIDPTGLVYIPLGQKRGADDGAALIRVEGADKPVRDKLAHLEKHFARYRGRAAEDTTTHTLFRDVTEGKPFLELGCDIWRLCVAPSRAYEALQACGALGDFFWYADWAGGLLWLGLPANTETAATLRGVTKKFGGHATLVRAGAEARASLDVFEPEIAAHAALTRSVKAAFDSKRLFNPGRMFKDI